MQQLKPRTRVDRTVYSEDSLLEDVDTSINEEDSFLSEAAVTDTSVNGGPEEGDSLLSDREIAEVFSALNKPGGKFHLGSSQIGGGGGVSHQEYIPLLPVHSDTVHSDDDVTDMPVVQTETELVSGLKVRITSEQKLLDREETFVEDFPSPTKTLPDIQQPNNDVRVNETLHITGRSPSVEEEIDIINSSGLATASQCQEITFDPVTEISEPIAGWSLDTVKLVREEDHGAVAISKEDCTTESEERRQDGIGEVDDRDDGSVGHVKGYHSLPNESEESGGTLEGEGGVQEERGYHVLQTEESQQEVVVRRDEHGNMLDEQGHPIIRHPFPDTWILQPDEGDGIMRFETESGPVRFIMNLTEGGFDYPNPPNELRLELDVYHKHVPTTHRLAPGCEMFVDTGNWRLQLDTEMINLLLRMDIARDFEDITGEVLWNDSKEITIENLTRAWQIYKDSEMDDSPVRLLLEMDAQYNPRDAVFRLSVGQDIENITRSVEIPDGMDIVKSETTVSIPAQSDTEVRNVKRCIIYEDSILEDQGTRHLDSNGCRLEPTPALFLVSRDAELEDQGTRRLFNDDVELEDQGTRHLISDDSETVDIVREVKLNNNLGIENINRGHLRPDDMDKVDLRSHLQDPEGNNVVIERTPVLWDKGQFDGEVVDLTEHRLEMDVKFVPSPSKFKINALEIDDEYLEELSLAED